MTAEAVRQAVRRIECETDGLYFFRYFFKQRTGTKALINWHHALVDQTLEQVISGRIDRLIITIPPGYTKTEQAVISFMARGLALNPRARFMHLSYSDQLALLNSSQTRAVVKSAEFQRLWPRELRNDTDSKSLWWTEQGGGVYAASMRGQVTGFRAGQMEPGFTGALVIDDGVKPDDALTVEIGKVNERYNSTVQSRLAHQKIPVIVIMQRIAHNDLAGFLLRGGSGEKWHHLELPVDFPAEPYPAENTYGIPIPYGAPPSGVLWEAKHNADDVRILKTRPRLYRTQYKQRPTKGGEGGALWFDSTLERAHAVEILGAPRRTVVAIDPSVTANRNSDACGLVVAQSLDVSHVTDCDEQFEVLADHTAVMTPDAWAAEAIELHKQYDADAIIVETNQGGDLIELALRNAGYKGRVIGVHAKKGKYLRAEPIAPLYAQGKVRHAPRLAELEGAMLDFRIGMKDSPNRVDALVYALTELKNPTAQIGW